MKRRQFLTKSGMGMASMAVMSQIPHASYALGTTNIVKQPIGFQSYVLREAIGKDITKTLSEMVGFGYEHVEMCSPSGYKGPFEPLAKYSGTELKKIISDTGIQCHSSHFTFREMRTNLEERIDFANQLGLKHFVCSGGLDAPTLDEVKQKCDELNEMGRKIKAGGLVTGYHNHNVEFEHEFNGRPEYDILLEELDSDLVKMQFQTAVITLGYKAATYFEKYPGRFISAHLQDYSPSDTTKEIVLGQGITDWKEFFEASKKGGLEVVYVEMESNPGTLEGSVAYLKNL
ncbi:sugar phosphate isomerase/epimerase family protein [Ulvibacterium marinum]|uniref:Sugar phosphate isomerase/epimerase n=1 Tax=Ulvibacterium marinum TaxID=2419782 RepID=A0A3B0BYG5_9FLAO|nr:TIM barrel protein [Ulvibacterium marinum]RKN78122.1 sugar phosphate isomerase/epimerase [Ulvibacterium marinum]